MLNTPLDCEKSKGEVGEREGVDVTPAPPPLLFSPFPFRQEGQMGRRYTGRTHPLPIPFLLAVLWAGA